MKKDNKETTITKENIHLYYKFMNDEEKIKNSKLLDGILGSRRDAIVKHLWKDTGNYAKSIFFTSQLKYKVGLLSWYIEHSMFEVIDILKPIDEYIEDIKNSKNYKKYIADIKIDEDSSDSAVKIV